MTEAPQVITPAYLREHPLPEPGDAKSSRGTVLVVGGAVSTPGAAMLAGLAALRVGAGVLALAVAPEVAIPLAVEIPEAGVSPWARSSGRDAAGAVDGELLRERLDGCACALVGPGLDDVGVTRSLLEACISNAPSDSTFVLDAYALGALPGSSVDHDRLAGRVVLTPNRAEAARLLDVDSVDSASDVEVAGEIAQRWSAVVVYQGLVARPGLPPYTVATGHGGLGTSGSGDVLAGAVAGILARGTDPHLAACWATYLHAAAGDRLASRIGRLGFLARELLSELPLVMAELNT